MEIWFSAFFVVLHVSRTLQLNGYSEYFLRFLCSLITLFSSCSNADACFGGYLIGCLSRNQNNATYAVECVGEKEERRGLRGGKALNLPR